MNYCITDTNYNFRLQKSIYKGKVRDVYTLKNGLLVIVATDRISAFDTILPKGIPYKGQILNSIAAMFLKQTSGIIKNWLIDTPHPNVSIGYHCQPFKIEMVVRGYLTGHAFREYSKGKRELCGEEMPNGLKENDPFPQPIITPTTKAINGQHDTDISRQQIIQQGIVSKKDYEILEKKALKLFELGSQFAKSRGLILVDTKYEFGKNIDDEIVLIDEIHTPDSSRFFYSKNYNQKQLNNEPQKQLSKEFVRQWLINNGFQGLKNQQVPLMTTEFINSVTNRYTELYELITGENFQKDDSINLHSDIEIAVNKFIASIK